MTAAPLTFTIDATRATAVVRGMPKVAYFWLRDYLRGSMIDHRVRWLSLKGNRFGRGGRGIKVHRVDEGPPTPGPKDVLYRVQPKAKRAANADAARADLSKVGAETFTGNEVLLIHEVGRDLRPSKARYMAIPARGTRPGDIRAWRSKNPTAVLITRPWKPGRLLVFQVTRGGGRRRKAEAGAEPAKRGKWKLRFILADRVDMKPTLQYYAAWDQLAATRDEKFRRTVDRMFADLERADPRDL